MSRRLNALVIGNAAYEAVDELKNPVNDAKDVGCKLETCGFTVIRESDSSHADMDRALKRLQHMLKESDVGLFFFAGHGMQIDGENYLAAVDTDAADEITAKHSSLALNRVIEVMEKSGCCIRLWFICCVPASTSTQSGHGLDTCRLTRRTTPRSTSR